MPLGTVNVERHSWCVGVLSLRRPGALRGIRLGAGGQAPARLGVRPGLVRIGGGGRSNPDWNARMSNPDWEMARSNPDREHGRVKSETGKGGTKKRKNDAGMLVFTSGFLLGF